jgi:hypothetical protein
MQAALSAATLAYLATVDVVSSAKHAVRLSSGHAENPTTDAAMVANDDASDTRLQRVKVAA